MKRFNKKLLILGLGSVAAPIVISPVISAANNDSSEEKVNQVLQTVYGTLIGMPNNRISQKMSLAGYSLYGAQSYKNAFNYKVTKVKTKYGEGINFGEKYLEEYWNNFNEKHNMAINTEQTAENVQGIINIVFHEVLPAPYEMYKQFEALMAIESLLDTDEKNVALLKANSERITSEFSSSPSTYDLLIKYIELIKLTSKVSVEAAEKLASDALEVKLSQDKQIEELKALLEKAKSEIEKLKEAGKLKDQELAKITAQLVVQRGEYSKLLAENQAQTNKIIELQALAALANDNDSKLVDFVKAVNNIFKELDLNYNIELTATVDQYNNTIKKALSDLQNKLLETQTDLNNHKNSVNSNNNSTSWKIPFIISTVIAVLLLAAVIGVSLKKSKK
ncbi:hypothetical protein C4M98_00700 [Mycoplasmopsis pullorum]|uniref:hypothetical protein n=1 Tax=Mycoplasmopsis pullorum TaxID=48003 RepID=UPI001117DB20|nr:hypothetical protein [Mycoplasmopsis pullorum]TNK81732.1 hypothetical protein C4M94_03180 [Mycoplasmopsis pullorum]TNK83137.1 hypothetical protein C4M80_01340 [Mycoplasmopsis pullorum]TNK84754.1 hypothetical protein C4M81_01415 [Mycoplasmopsis pullorum]TNK85415.1 hypothetical protein C4M92_01495 [Mycoplasmopsis pullorum]TNK86029.1 hypothetical protein C4M85_01540 [Mycoplasmopsis pullorum]